MSSQNFLRAGQQDPQQESCHGNGWVSCHLFHYNESIANSSHAFESLSFTSKPWEKECHVCALLFWVKKGRSGLFNTFVREGTGHSQEAHGKDPLKRGIKVKREKWVFECYACHGINYYLCKLPDWSLLMVKTWNNREVNKIKKWKCLHNWNTRDQQF